MRLWGGGLWWKSVFPDLIVTAQRRFFLDVRCAGSRAPSHEGRELICPAFFGHLFDGFSLGGGGQLESTIVDLGGPLVI